MLLRNSLKFSLTSLFVLGILMLFPASSNAFENSISGININQASNGAYDIVLKMSKNAPVKTILTPDNLTITVNSTLPSDSMEIIYDNTSELNNVTVQKKNTDNTVISLQGKGLENVNIYTKDISTGLTKQINSSEGILNNLFYVADKKLLGSSLFVMFLLFLMMATSKPKQKKNAQVAATKAIQARNNSNMTLRRKNMLQSQNIPSINSKLNGSFNASRMTTPRDLMVNGNAILEEERKVS